MNGAASKDVVQLDGNDYYLQTDTDDVSIADDKSDSEVIYLQAIGDSWVTFIMPG